MNSLDYEIFTGVNVLIVAILHANYIKRCMITINERLVCKNVFNDELKTSLCKYPYGLSLDFRYQIYGILIFFFLKLQAVLGFQPIHVTLSLNRFLFIYQS